MREFPDYIRYTPGTTGGKLPVLVYKSETDAYRDLVLKQIKIPRTLPLTLSIMGFGNSSQLFSGELPVIPAYLNSGVKQIVDLLQKTYNYASVDSKITVIEGNLLTIRRLTFDLLDQGYDPSIFGIKLIAPTGWLITRHLWKLLEDLWGSTIVDRFCVPEVHGDAKFCKLCKGYHFDFTVIPEVVHPLTLLPIKDGIGALILTDLYPFNQARPLIRYWIGDFFEIKSARCNLNEPSYIFKGRTIHTIYWVDGEKVYYLLFPTDVVQILDEFPDIARKKDTEFLKFRAESNFQTQPFHVNLFVELRYCPELYPNRIAELRERTFEGLIECNSTFKRFIKEKVINFKIEFLGPEKLDRIFEV
jgi:phenylacetate-coenzyme A ligase PaaK-like adenylate-forming protein